MARKLARRLLVAGGIVLGLALVALVFQGLTAGLRPGADDPEAELAAALELRQANARYDLVGRAEEERDQARRERNRTAALLKRSAASGIDLERLEHELRLAEIGIRLEPDERLRVGMSADARVVVGEHQDAMLVPNLAIMREPGGPVVRVLDAADGGAVRMRRIQTGYSDGLKTVVRDGLRDGEAVLVRRKGEERVRGGVPSARWIAAEYPQSVAARTPYRTRVAVVSGATPELPQVFFGAEDPLGQAIQLDGVPFRVIGVLGAKGMQFVTQSARHDQMIFIPLSRAQRLFDLRDRIGAILVEPDRLDELDRLSAELAAALRPPHRLSPDDEEALQTFSIPEITAPFRRIAMGLEWLLGSIGTVVLAMAGVGVANLMVATGLVSGVVPARLASQVDPSVALRVT